MDYSPSFGYWVRRRRKILDVTQAELAGNVSCSLSMLRKIERDERRPSVQLAELLADHLAVEEQERQAFLRLARGQFVPDITSPVTAGVALPLVDDNGEQPANGQKGTPFVGRQGELRRLHDTLSKVVTGEGYLLFVGGEAGSGKTTLLQEFARQAQDAWPQLLVAGGAAIFTPAWETRCYRFAIFFACWPGTVSA
ncbi:MAG: XRE family transcriptional regulator [Anaerolineae bacterium]|nr:XRE family transcriptional regulator [Anaerolineae bacterium]